MCLLNRLLIKKLFAQLVSKPLDLIKSLEFYIFRTNCDHIAGKIASVSVIILALIFLSIYRRMDSDWRY